MERIRKIPRRTSGWRKRELEHDEGHQQRSGDRKEAERCERYPARGLGVDERVDQQAETRGDGHRSGDVEAACILDPALGNVTKRKQDGDHANGHIHEEHPLPREGTRQHAAEEQADGATTDCDGTPDAEGRRPFTAFLEGGRQHGQRGRGDERAAKTLQGTACHENPCRSRQPIQERGSGEEHDAENEQAAPAEEVGSAAAEHQESTERERVRVDDPLQALGREVQSALNRRQRDVDDGGIEDDHELRDSYNEEDEPGIDAARFHCVRPHCGGRIGARAPLIGYYTERWFRLSNQGRTRDEHREGRGGPGGR